MLLPVWAEGKDKLKKDGNMATSEELRRKYVGRSATLNGKPAKIKSIENGRAAAVISSRESGEASWFKVKEVMEKKGGRFVLSRGHLAV